MAPPAKAAAAAAPRLGRAACELPGGETPSRPAGVGAHSKSNILGCVLGIEMRENIYNKL